MESIEEIITNQPFFSGFSPGNIDLLADCASIVNTRRGEFIFKTGEDATRFYIICEGEVSLELLTPKGTVIEIQTLGISDILGWSWQFPPYKWNFDAKTITDTKLISFDAKRFFDTCRVNLLFAYELQKIFSRVMLYRLQATRKQLIELKNRIPEN